MPRPSSYTNELAQEICDRLIDGESMRSICKSDDMPNRATVLRWMEADPGFAAKCARARELQADAIFEDLQEIADHGNPEDVQRAKLRVSTMQWRAAKLAPKKYGDKVAMEHTGKDGGPIQTYDLTKAEDGDLEKLEALLSKVASGAE